MKIQIMLAMNMMIILMKLHHHRSQTLGGFKKCFEDQDQIHEIAATGTMKMSANSPVRHFTFILVRFPLSCHNAKYRRKRKHKLGDRQAGRQTQRPQASGRRRTISKGKQEGRQTGKQIGRQAARQGRQALGMAGARSNGGKQERKQASRQAGKQTRRQLGDKRDTLEDTLKDKCGDNKETSWKTSSETR